jgi:ABC-2 type transport system permease protein
VTRLLRLFGLQIVRQVLTWSGAWWFTVALAAGQLVPPLIGLAVWHSVFPHSSGIAKYYVAILFVVATTASYENHTFSQSIYKGTLSDELVKPQPALLAPLGENVAIRVWISIVALPVALLVVVATTAAFRPADVLIAVPAWLGAGLLRFLFTWCLAMTAFWTERVHAITAFGATLLYLLGGNAVPIDLLPPGWSTAARYLPFYSMLGLPADTAIGLSAGSVLSRMAVQAGWLMLLACMAALLWRRGLSRYTAVGG